MSAGYLSILEDHSLGPCAIYSLKVARCTRSCIYMTYLASTQSNLNTSIIARREQWKRSAFRPCTTVQCLKEQGLCNEKEPGLSPSPVLYWLCGLGPITHLYYVSVFLI